jgi:fibro-slime domain-containing protein
VTSIKQERRVDQLQRGRLPLALLGAALLAAAGCSSAEIMGEQQGGAGGGQRTGGGGSGAKGGAGGAGGIFVNLDARPLADAGVDRPGGGTCGDGIVERNEQCDDGNTANGDGCSRLCQVEANWSCPIEGAPCEYLGVCGNGALTSNKACDDGNTASGDGCSADCQTVEPGFICRVPGKPCTTRCGDGAVKGFEVCDDGNTTSGDGCSATCKVEAGFDCSGNPSRCQRTVCGNGVREAGEGCDDGNTLPLDGCSATCQSEPKCGTFDAQGKLQSAVGACKSECGDGIVWRGFEACDDGNQRDGDGCSHDCKVEAGFTCKTDYDSPPDKLVIPIIVRDFMWYSSGPPPSGHPDFGTYCCNDELKKGKGIVATTLGLDRKPSWAGPSQDPITNAADYMFTGKSEFNQWYQDVSGTNQTFYQTLTLLQNATTKTTYAMNSDTDEPFFDRCGFFPLDSTPRKDANTGKIMTYTDNAFPGRTCTVYDGLGFGTSWANHNFSFTSEVRTWFQYQGSESLKFTGDDDVWVFINGMMVVEMPGVHNRLAATVILDAAKGTAQVGYGEPPSSYTTIDLKLSIGNVYEVAVFQAERWCCESNYMLTLANFLAGKSQCVPACGDGVVVADEECDCGSGSTAVPAGCPAANGDAVYGGCTTECKWGPFCGDGVTQPTGREECDLGKQNGDGTSKCTITCQAPRSCGDGSVDTDLSEECDLGANNGVKLDRQLQPATDDPEAQVFCLTDCTIPSGIVY